MWWWHGVQHDGWTRVNRYSYLSEKAARRDNPDAPMISGVSPSAMAESLEGVA